MYADRFFSKRQRGVLPSQRRGRFEGRSREPARFRRLLLESLERRCLLAGAGDLLLVGIAPTPTDRLDTTGSYNNAGLLLIDNVSTGGVTPLHAPFTSTSVLDQFQSGEGFSGLAFLPDGRLFGTTSVGSGSTSALVRINPGTGEVTFRTPIRVGANPINIGDLAWNPQDGRLYGVRSGDDGGPVGLYLTDPDSGTATPAATAGFEAALRRADGLAFATDGTPYISGLNGATGAPLLLNARTGQVVALSVPLLGLAFDRASGRFIGTRSGQDEPAWLDPSTGALSPIVLDNPPRGVGGDLDFPATPNQYAVQVVFQTDFEHGESGFTAENGGGTVQGLWHYSVGRYADGQMVHTPDHNWYYGQFESSVGAGSYVQPRDHEGVLISPPMTIPQCGTIVGSFNYLLSTRPELDRDFVEVSAEYVDAAGQTQHVPLLSRAAGTLPQTDHRWRTATLDLSQFAGQEIRLRFAFDTGDRVPYDPEGWYIDDVLVTQLPTAACFLKVTKTGTPSPVVAGTNLTYTIEVENTGPTVSDGFTVTDPLPPGTTPVLPLDSGCTVSGNTVICVSDGLQPGDKVTWTIVVHVEPSVPAGTILANTACASPNSNRDNDCSTERTPVIHDADLKVTKTASPDPVVAGTDLTYTITVENLGPSASDGFTVTDPLPPGTTPVLPLDPDCALSGNTVICTSDGLQPGDEVTWTIVVHVEPSVPAGTILANTACASPNSNPDNDCSTEKTPVIHDADLKVTKIASPDPVVAGTDVTYTITVENLGPSASGGFTVTDTLPPGTTPVLPLDPDCALSGNTVICTSDGLQLGEKATWMLIVHVDPSVPEGATLTNQAVLPRDSNPGNDSAMTETKVIRRADLKVTKTASPDPVVAGTDVTYTITVENLGPSASDGFTVTDPLPPGTTPVLPLDPDCALSGNTVICTSDGLQLGEKATWMLIVHVDPSVPDGATLTNQAVLPRDSNSGNDSATTETKVIRRADLKVTKTASPDPVVAGTDLTYTITVENLGPSDNGGFTLKDVLPAGTTFVAATNSACTNVDNTVTCTSNGLSLHETVSWTVVAQVARVEPSIPVGTSLANTAAIASHNTVDPNPDNDRSTIQTELIETLQFISPMSFYRPSGPLTPPAPVTTVPAPDAGKGSIKGYKWNDLDQDGIWDANEPGRPGWRMFLDLNDDGVFNPELEKNVATTGTDGSYLFANLSPGPYTIREDTNLLSNGTFTVQMFPSAHAFTVNLAAGQIIAGRPFVAETPNFGGFDYSPFIRPADDYLGHLRLMSATDKATLFAALTPWQSFNVSNTTMAALNVVNIAVSSIDPNAGHFVKIVDANLQPVTFPLAIAAGSSRQLFAFFDPAIRNAAGDVTCQQFAEGDTVCGQFPDWFGAQQNTNGAFTFAFGDHLKILTDTGPAFRVNLVGGSTYDSDIFYDGAVDNADILRLANDLPQRSPYPILANSPFFDPTSDINARCPNGAGGEMNTCTWPINGTPLREIGLGDFGPLNVELSPYHGDRGFGRARAPFLDLDADNNSGARGVDRAVDYNGSPVKLLDADASFANSLVLTLASVTVEITNPQEGDALNVGVLSPFTANDIVGNGSTSLTVTRAATIKQYLDLLRTVTFANGITPAGARTVEVKFTLKGGSDFQPLANVPQQEVGNHPIARIRIVPAAHTISLSNLNAAPEGEAREIATVNAISAANTSSARPLQDFICRRAIALRHSSGTVLDRLPALIAGASDATTDAVDPFALPASHNRLASRLDNELPDDVRAAAQMPSSTSRAELDPLVISVTPSKPALDMSAPLPFGVDDCEESLDRVFSEWDMDEVGPNSAE